MLLDGRVREKELIKICIKDDQIEVIANHPPTKKLTPEDDLGLIE
jgi:hypothetical protein